MERKQLSINDRKAVEDGKLLVETRDGRPARVLCWDRRGDAPIVALVPSSDDPGNVRLSHEGITVVYPNGMLYYNVLNENDLFVVENEDYTPKEPEQSSAVDWAAFRRDAAKEFVGALIYSGRQCLAPREWFCEQGIGFADELIKKLKENQK